MIDTNNLPPNPSQPPPHHPPLRPQQPPTHLLLNRKRNPFHPLDHLPRLSRVQHARHIDDYLQRRFMGYIDRRDGVQGVQDSILVHCRCGHVYVATCYHRWSREERPETSDCAGGIRFDE